MRCLIGLLLLSANLAQATQIALGLPIDCRIGVDCHIQNYVDHDAGVSWRDYACGSLSYDGHDGTDFRVADLPAMLSGVNVLASAAGEVVAVRDGEPDMNVNQRGYADLRGKDAGNSVRIRHADGWETQYAHMKRGSVAVREGQRVLAGATLGQVGLSGNTEFPHVHLTVRHHGKAVDPFAPIEGNCGEPQPTLWHPVVAASLRYRSSGVLLAGFASTMPERLAAEAGAYVPGNFPTDAPAIVFWNELFGLRKDDVLENSVASPDGTMLAISRTKIERNKAVWFALTGKRRTDAKWTAGNYVGRVVLRRGNRAVIDETRTLVVREAE